MQFSIVIWHFPFPVDHIDLYFYTKLCCVELISHFQQLPGCVNAWNHNYHSPCTSTSNWYTSSL